MFNKEEISLMQILGLKFDFSNLSDDEWFEIEDRIGDELSTNGLDKDYKPNSIGVVCESILSKLP